MTRITPFLWFDEQAGEAAQFYTSIFKNSKIEEINERDGKVFTVSFVLDGQRFVALNGGPHFQFTEAISFVVPCKDQIEVDYYWQKLSEGGSESQCGWLRDPFGISWQVVPDALPELLNHTDPETSQRVMNAMLKMKKLDIQALQDAAKPVVV